MAPADPQSVPLHADEAFHVVICAVPAELARRLALYCGATLQAIDAVAADAIALHLDAVEGELSP